MCGKNLPNWMNEKNYLGTYIEKEHNLVIIINFVDTLYSKKKISELKYKE